MDNNGRERVLAIGDLHAPFEHPDALEFLRWVKKRFEPTKTVIMGDEADFHAISDYDHDPDGDSPGRELARAIEHLKEFYVEFPKARVCTSNHTSRPFRKAYKTGLPKAVFRSYREFLRAPKGWYWDDKFEIDGVVYQHGDPFTGKDAAIKAAQANMQSTVIGHVHSFAGIQYNANHKHLYYGFNVGCLIDAKSYAFSYGKTLPNKPIIGCGIITRGVPTFVPMLLDSKGRWIKR